MSNARSAQAKRYTNGNNQSLSRTSDSPNTLSPAASQYGTTGGHRTFIAGSGLSHQNTEKP